MYELYSKRIKNQKGEPEVFVYDNFSSQFRNHFIYNFEDLINEVKINTGFVLQLDKVAETTIKYFEREKGLRNEIQLSYDGLLDYLQNCSSEDFLDILDMLIFAYYKESQSWTSESFGNGVRIKNDRIENLIKTAVEKLNKRLKEHSLGYVVVNGEVLRKDNETMHEKVIKPTLKLLLNEEFRGVEEEYLSAFEAYKNGDNENAILNANKAFESMLKVLCINMKYDISKEKDTAKTLIKKLEDNNFYPSYLNNHIGNIRISLESGAPVVRNKVAGHGQGDEVRIVGDEYVEYVLNLVSSNIIFLYKIYERKLKEEK